MIVVNIKVWLSNAQLWHDVDCWIPCYSIWECFEEHIVDYAKKSSRPSYMHEILVFSWCRNAVFWRLEFCHELFSNTSLDRLVQNLCGCIERDLIVVRNFTRVIAVTWQGRDARAPIVESPRWAWGWVGHLIFTEISPGDQRAETGSKHKD